MDAPELTPPVGVPALEHRDQRRTAAVGWARGFSWLWLVPLAGLALWLGYVTLIFVGMVSEALGGELTAWVVALAFAPTAVAFVLAAASGVAAAWWLARWAAGARRLARLRPWAIGLASATLGGCAAWGLFRFALTTGASLLGPG